MTTWTFWREAAKIQADARRALAMPDDRPEPPDPDAPTVLDLAAEEHEQALWGAESPQDAEHGVG